jgi:hypothetical protein
LAFFLAGLHAPTWFLGRARKQTSWTSELVVLGHSQAQTTARYAHLDADPLLRAANLIGERIERSMNPATETISAQTS